METPRARLAHAINRQAAYVDEQCARIALSELSVRSPRTPAGQSSSDASAYGELPCGRRWRTAL